ncbi:MAG: extracellular solute-binding protein [Austwickia sp.]|jgi:iron(III) transport system substrate-binding protein|nr:MAG: extracellular solute-binding protein [Austwickia sp.]
MSPAPARPRFPHRQPRVLAVVLATSVAAVGCGTTPTPSSSGSATTSSSASDSTQTVTIYSGRSEKLVAPLLAKVEAATGVKVNTRYGESSALAAQILEEGDRSPADLLFSQDAGALGALAKAGKLAPLPEQTTAKVKPGYADPQRAWVATSARARVVAYHPAQAPAAATMTSIDAVLDPTYRGKVGYAPTNASFHSFVTALRVSRGEAAAKKWLTDFKANQPKAYDKNGTVLKAVDSGEVSLGLINHYYWNELAKEKGADKVTAKIRFLGTDDPGALVNVAGAGVLASSKHPEAAAKVVDYLVSNEAQQYFVDQTAEYPAVPGVSTTKHQLTPLEGQKTSSVDLNSLDSLPATLALLSSVGLT